jgi:heme a synthase
MIKHDKNINYLFLNWLTISLFLVFSIIIVGGLTRLTNSGLSITEWELFKGLLPPLNESAWIEYFELYKKIPQYKIMNHNMNIDDFKIIFYWEYFHRVLGRIIGIFFLLPLIYFHFNKKVNIKYLKICYLIMLLIIFQGIIGWFMVKSGLTNNVTVSHYRLALHLVVALIIISLLFWLILNIRKKKYKNFFNLSKKNFPFLFLFLLIFLQIIFGAFVSGLDAGRIYQTWPLMGYYFFPNDFRYESYESFLNFNNHSLVQFYHRNLAYLITLYILGFIFYIYIKKIYILFKPIIIMSIFLLLQIILGILTLITGLNIYFASLHQICSVILIFSTINLYYSHIK